MTIDLTPIETTFAANLLRQVQVSASAPDAPQVVAVVQSLLAKLTQEKPRAEAEHTG